MTKNNIIKFIYDNNILQLGTKKLKNGDYSDHFYDFGQVCSGDQLSKLVGYLNNNLNDDEFNMIFTSAYKGIIIGTALLMECNTCFPEEKIKFGYFRKEEKDHGEKGRIVGHIPTKFDKVLLFDDVLTTGESLYEMYDYIQTTKAQITSAFFIINRANKSQFDKIQKKVKMPIYYFLTDDEILEKFDEYRNKNV